MKKLALILILISNTIVGQDLAHSFGRYQKSLTYKRSEPFLLNDSLRMQFEYRDLSVYSDEGELFHAEVEYVKGNEKVNIITRQDGKILFRLYRDSSLIQTGELKSDTSNFKTEVGYVYDSIYGNDVVAEISDTMYFLHPCGIWTVNHSQTVYEKGNYLNGKKAGDWITYDVKIKHLPIHSKTYRDGILIHDSLIGLVDQKIIGEYLVNKWIGVGYAYISSSSGLTFLKREGASPYGGQMKTGQFSALQLEKNQKFKGHKYSSCGNGNYGNEYWNTKGKWKIIQEESNYYLLLNKEKFRIFYMTKDKMILKS